VVGIAILRGNGRANLLLGWYSSESGEGWLVAILYGGQYGQHCDFSSSNFVRILRGFHFARVNIAILRVVPSNFVVWWTFQFCEGGQCNFARVCGHPTVVACGSFLNQFHPQSTIRCGQAFVQQNIREK
jgi:hypothetical protein